MTTHDCRVCGRQYAVPDEWQALELKGYAGRFRGAGGEPMAVELRQCECGNTMAEEVAMPARRVAAGREGLSHG